MITTKRILVLSTLVLMSCMTFAQMTRTEEWKKIRDDETSTIYYNPKITKDRNGNYIVWVKTIFHSVEWQRYMAQQIGNSSPVTMTKTKAMYDKDYIYAMVRQVICYNKAGKVLFNSGDDTSAGWGLVNASDPVGLVGEYLGEQMNNNDYY
jgi:hypothetical protein